jgi:hypothetical protein
MAISGRPGARSTDSRYSRSIGTKLTVISAQPASPVPAHQAAAAPPPAARPAIPASAAAGGSA